MSNNNSFSKREWLMTIGIIIVIEFVVLTGAWIYSTNQSVLDYISFTGTIVSIILALLAIIYAFVQTFRQQNSSQKLRSQIDQLVGVVNNIEDSKGDLNDVLEQIISISGKVDESIEKQAVIKSEIETLKTKFDEDDFRSNKSGQERPLLGIERDNLSQLILLSAPGITFNLLIIYHGFMNNLSVKGTIDKYAQEYATRYQKENYDFYHAHTHGTLIAIFTILNILDLIDYDDIDNEYELSEELKSKIESYITLVKEDEIEEESEIIQQGISLAN